MSYILITPVKNEEDNLPKLAECIINQTRSPSAWFIVDDNSIDQTSRIINDLTREYDWIYYIKKEEISEYGHLSFASSIKVGYEHAGRICELNNIDYNYIGKIDADILLPKNYFEKIIDEFENDHRLAIVSGSYFNINGRLLTKPLYILDEMADERLYRKEFLDEIGGFPVTYSPDTVLLIKAKLRNWKFKILQDVQCYGVRNSYQEGIWKRSKNMGYGRYFLNYHPLLVLLGALYMMIKRPYYHAFAYCYGYLLGIINRDIKIEDIEMRYYFRYKRWNEIKDKIRLLKREKKSWFRVKNFILSE